MNKIQAFDQIGGGLEDLPPIFYIHSFPLYQQKVWKLMDRGYSQEKAEKLCKPEPIDYKKMEAEVMEMQKKTLRDLAKLSPKPEKPVKCQIRGPIRQDEIVIGTADLEYLASLKTIDTKPSLA